MLDSHDIVRSESGFGKWLSAGHGQREGVQEEAKESNWEDNSTPDGNEMSLGVPNSSGTPKALLVPIPSGGEEIPQGSL